MHCREKTPPYALDYTNPINNINYETINNLKNKEILINNENAHLLVEKSALEKNLKKHSMFINALSWKKFNSNKKKSSDGNIKNKGIAAFRTPLDNIHPIVDNNKNIQNALCHGSKSSSLVDSKRNLDIVRNNGNTGTTGTTGAGSQPQGHMSQHQSAVSNSSSSHPHQRSYHLQTGGNSNNILQNSKHSNTNLINNNNINNFQQTTTDQTDHQGNIKKKVNDNDDIIKKTGSSLIKTEQLTKPAPKKTVIQVK